MGSKSNSNEEKAFKWLAIGTEIPIMVFLGAFLGYEFGRRLGFPYDYVGLTLGAILGFVTSILAMLRGLGAFKRRKEKKKGLNKLNPRRVSPLGSKGDIR
ncbi:MAG: hypothetical protein QXO94_05220 [Candidatus Bathyarchaeia archaeon]